MTPPSNPTPDGGVRDWQARVKADLRGKVECVCTQCAEMMGSFAAVAHEEGYVAGQRAARAEAEGELAEVRKALDSWKALARLEPDNHHNAAACPYCRPTLEQERRKQAEAEGECRRLREALHAVRSPARGYPCWCDESHDAVEHGHQPKCVTAEAALTSPEGGEKGGGRELLEPCWRCGHLIPPAETPTATCPICLALPKPVRG